MSSRIIYEKLDVYVSDSDDLPPVIAEALKNKAGEKEDQNIKLFKTYLDQPELPENIRTFLKSQIKKLESQPKVDPNEELIKEFAANNPNLSVEKIEGGVSISRKNL